MTMDTATAIDVIDVVLDELVTLHILPVKRYEDMSEDQRKRLVALLIRRFGTPAEYEKLVRREQVTS